MARYLGMGVGDALAKIRYFAVGASTTIEDGDGVYVYKATGIAVPVSATALWSTDLPTTQRIVAAGFVGIAMGRVATGAAEKSIVCVDTAHNATYDCASTAFTTLGYIGFAKDSGNNLLAQTVAAVASADLAVGEMPGYDTLNVDGTLPAATRVNVNFFGKRIFGLRNSAQSQTITGFRETSQADITSWFFMADRDYVITGFTGALGTTLSGGDTAALSVIDDAGSPNTYATLSLATASGIIPHAGTVAIATLPRGTNLYLANDNTGSSGKYLSWTLQITPA